MYTYSPFALRSDMVLLYELKLALANCEFELQTLRHRYEALAPGKLPSKPTLTLGAALAAGEAIGGTKASSSASSASAIGGVSSSGGLGTSLSAALSIGGSEESLRGDDDKDMKEEPLSPGTSRKVSWAGVSVSVSIYTCVSQCLYLCLSVSATVSLSVCTCVCQYL